MTEPQDEERIVAHLLRSDPSPGPAGPCLDADWLAGWAEGRLDAERRALVEGHLASCDACRAAATELFDALSERPAGTEPEEAADPAAAPVLSLPAARRRRVGAFALAASILLALGAGFLALRGGGGDGVPDAERALADAADELRSGAPQWFAGFEPAGPAERRSAASDARRASLLVLRPAGVVLETRPRLEWADATGASAYEVVLAGPDGAEVWRGRSNGPTLDLPGDAPELVRGTSYVLEVTAVGPAGTAGGPRATRGFRVASAEEAGAWEGAVREAGRRVDPSVRDLVLAHAAARRGLLLEALTRTEAHLAAKAEPVGEETRAWVEGLLAGGAAGGGGR
jgi:hypothetical protein